MKLENQQVVIIGGTSGIGLATARMLIAEGAKVIVASRQRDKVDQALMELEESARGEVVDTTSREALQGFFKRVGAFDHLILTLGGSEGAGEFRTLDFDSLRRAFEAKFWPQLLAAQVSLDYLRSDGSLTLVSAVTAHTAYSGASGLGALNGALEAMVPTLALELQPLRVNAVAPGLIATPWWNGLPSEAREAIFSQAVALQPVKRLGQPEDVAQVISMLLANPFMTNSIIDCDGGARIRSSLV